MSNNNDIASLVSHHNRRLQKLKERQALQGQDVDVAILLEIEDIEKEIEELLTKFSASSSQPTILNPQNNPTYLELPPRVTKIGTTLFLLAIFYTVLTITVESNYHIRSILRSTSFSRWKSSSSEESVSAAGLLLPVSTPEPIFDPPPIETLTVKQPQDLLSGNLSLDLLNYLPPGKYSVHICAYYKRSCNTQVYYCHPYFFYKKRMPEKWKNRFLEERLTRSISMHLVEKLPAGVYTLQLCRYIKLHNGQVAKDCQATVLHKQ